MSEAAKGKPIGRADIRCCDVCDGPLKAVVFYIVEVHQAILDANAVREHAGLEMMSGGGIWGAWVAAAP